MLSRMALSGIHFYQHKISPHKGFSCAYRVYHNDDTGCSGYAKRKIQELGFLKAIPFMLQRKRDCKAAAISIKERCARGECGCKKNEMRLDNTNAQGNEEDNANTNNQRRRRSRSQNSDNSCDRCDACYVCGDTGSACTTFRLFGGGGGRAAGRGADDCTPDCSPDCNMDCNCDPC